MNSPIFIGGCGSSGTTLLRRMLAAHPNIACGPEMSVFDRPRTFTEDYAFLLTAIALDDFDGFDEGMFFPIQLPGGRTYFGLAEGNSGPKYYHPSDVVRQVAPTLDSTKAFFEWYFGSWAEAQGAQRWAEKTPGNVFQIKEIFEMFPDAKFLNVVRDGRDVVTSLVQRRGWGLPNAITRWVESVRAWPEKWEQNGFLIQIHYEDLVQRTAEALSYICDFIGEEFNPSMLSYWKRPLPEQLADDNPIKDYATQPVHSDSIGRWKKVDDPVFQRKLRLNLTPHLEALGYEV